MGTINIFRDNSNNIKNHDNKINGHQPIGGGNDINLPPPQSTTPNDESGIPFVPGNLAFSKGAVGAIRGG